MRNREKYFIKANEYDIMKAINQNTGICPIRAVAGITTGEKLHRCSLHIGEGCNNCIQDWLNEKAKGSEKEC